MFLFLSGLAAVFLMNWTMLSNHTVDLSQGNHNLPKDSKFINKSISQMAISTNSTSSVRLRVGTFNVWNFKGNWKERLQKIAELVRISTESITSQC
jgi:hypothetical protein